jgi:uncharacterized Tic20 family protein
MNNEIPLKLRLIATGSHLVGAISSILFIFLWLIHAVTLDSSFMILLSIISAAIIQPIVVAFYWVITENIHPFVDRAGRNAVNCAVSNLFGTIASILFCTFIFSVTCGVGNQDPTLFFISLFILCCVELAYFINSVAFGIFALKGYNFDSILIHPFLKYD